jgi:hypothetical protein
VDIAFCTRSGRIRTISVSISTRAPWWAKISNAMRDGKWTPTSSKRRSVPPFRASSSACVSSSPLRGEVKGMISGVSVYIRQILPTSVLPISCRSPSTVPSTTRPMGEIADPYLCDVVAQERHPGLFRRTRRLAHVLDVFLNRAFADLHLQFQLSVPELVY